MDDSNAAHLASMLSVDAKYLADCLERFRAVGEVRIPAASVEFLLGNYRLAIKALGGEAGEQAPLEHPSLRGAEALKTAREEAVQKMQEANATMRSVMGAATRGE